MTTSTESETQECFKPGCSREVTVLDVATAAVCDEHEGMDAGEWREALARRARERERQRPRRERLERKGRVRNKYRLLDKWKTALEEFDGPGEAALVDGYRPNGFPAPVDVAEIAGLVVWDADRRAHHFRLYRDGGVHFIESPSDPDAPIVVDPMTDPGGDNTVYLTEAPPPAVTERLDALGVTPRWGNACPDGEHDFETANEGHYTAFVQCRKCETSRGTLSWLGHAVPRGEP